MAKKDEGLFRPIPPPFIMDTADLKETLDLIPKNKKIKIYKKIILALAEYHGNCHKQRVILADKLERIISGLDKL